MCKKVRYARGRPKKGQSRNIASEYYILDAKVQPNLEHIEQKRQEAGCFVLLSNVHLEGDGAQTGADLLRAYKEQYGIERNFSFLKDPLIVNDMFLNPTSRPKRIKYCNYNMLPLSEGPLWHYFCCFVSYRRFYRLAGLALYP